jgi:hypothetical protein
MVKAGDSIPSIELVEDNPRKKVNLAQELSSGKGLLIGVPAAFSRSMLLLSRVSPFCKSLEFQIRLRSPRFKCTFALMGWSCGMGLLC